MMEVGKQDRRTVLGAIVAFFVGLVLGQQEKAPQKTMLLLYNGIYHSVEKPGKIKINCKPTVIKYDFQLEAVGIDTDGTFKRLKDLSYLAT